MKWFKHDTDASQDAKLQNVLLDYGLEGYGLYWYCLELIAGKVDAENVTFELEHDARVIARNTGSTAEKVEGMMRYFVNVGLFENTQGVISCLKMAKRLDKSMTSNPEMRKVIESMSSNQTVLDGFVYLIEKRDANKKVIAVKIGRSKNPSSRISELSKLGENIGFSLECVHKIKSDNCVALETELHRKFKHLNIHNEWFMPSEEIYNYMGTKYVMTTSGYVMQEEIRLEEKNTLSSPRVSRADDVPIDRIVEAYNTVLGGTLPRAQRMTDTRRKQIRARWREMLGTTDANGKLRYADQDAGVEWFGRFFRKVLTNPHWTGDNDRGWTASLDWVMNPTNFTKILEYVPHDARKP